MEVYSHAYNLMVTIIWKQQTCYNKIKTLFNKDIRMKSIIQISEIGPFLIITSNKIILQIITYTMSQWIESSKELKVNHPQWAMAWWVRFKTY